MAEQEKSRPSSDKDGRIVTRTAGHIRWIGIDRPERYNAFNPKMLREFAQAFTDYENDDECRCALVYGEGANFTAGFDLRAVEFSHQIFPSGLVDPLDLYPPFRTKPVVMAVQGICFTMGVELALAADIVVAASDTRFAQLEVQRGVISFGGATIRMPERAGWGNAMRYLLTGDEFDAETALRLGFIQEVTEPGAQLDRARELAEAIAKAAPLAVQGMRRSAQTAARQGAAEATAEFEELVEQTTKSADFEEGVRAFLEKREAAFTGR
jgi:enoyl-CoA hydratase/carnithine racemase